MTNLPLISVIVPVFNEEDNVRRCYDAIKKVFASVSDIYRLEIFFSDNHSTDSTYELLAELAAADSSVKVIRLARNFGFQKSVLTAYRTVSGDAAVQIDCDLQDPPELILEFLKLWQQGNDVVVGVRRKRKESPLLQMARRAFYRLLRRISEDEFIDNAGDFRLVDRTVIERLKQVQDARPFTRGLVSALSIQQVGIPYDRNAREFGLSKFPVRRLFGFAMDGIVNHSLVPLRMATWIGIAVFVISMLMSLWFLGIYLVDGGDGPRGFTTLATLLLASIGLNAILIGILGEYIGRIYEQVRLRPLTLIESTLNVEKNVESLKNRGTL